MKTLLEEIRNNFSSFESSSQAERKKIYNELTTKITIYEQSYERIVSLQAWKSELIEETISSESLGFFIEGQNDILTSHVAARYGQWRLALQSLRASVEGILNSLYYKDHPVEMELWENQCFKLNFSDQIKYLKSHPLFVGTKSSINGLDLLNKEYATLSKAVHGSAVPFRMSESDGVLLWNSSPTNLSMWQTREKAVILGLNLVLLTIFREKLRGTKRRNLRKVISILFSDRKKKEIKKYYSMHLYKL